MDSNSWTVEADFVQREGGRCGKGYVGETTDDNEPELSMTRFMRGGTSAAFALRARRPCFCGAAKADKITELLQDG
jgi:hypothetical protein